MVPPVFVDDPLVVLSPRANKVVSVSSLPSEIVPVFLKSAVPLNVLSVPVMRMLKVPAPTASEPMLMFPSSTMSPDCPASPRVSVWSAALSVIACVEMVALPESRAVSPVKTMSSRYCCDPVVETTSLVSIEPPPPTLRLWIF